MSKRLIIEIKEISNGYTVEVTCIDPGFKQVTYAAHDLHAACTYAEGYLQGTREKNTSQTQGGGK